MEKTSPDRITLFIVSAPERRQEMGTVVFMISNNGIEIPNKPVHVVWQYLIGKGYKNVVREKKEYLFTDKGNALCGEGRLAYNLTLTTCLWLEVWEKK